MSNSQGPTARERRARERRRVEMTVIGDEWADLFDQLFRIPIGNKTVVEDFRQRHCLECNKRADAVPADRELHCKSRRCYMYEDEGFRRERDWAWQVIDRLLPVALANPAHINDFNADIARAGCLTPEIGVNPQGSLAVAYQADTLRAVVQLGLLMAVAYSAGDRLHIHVADHTGDAARKLHLVARGQHQKYLAGLALRLSGGINRPKLKLTEIAKKLDVSPQTLADWVEERKTHVPDPEAVAQWVPQVLPPSLSDGEDRLIEPPGSD